MLKIQPPRRKKVAFTRRSRIRQLTLVVLFKLFKWHLPAGFADMFLLFCDQVISGVEGQAVVPCHVHPTSLHLLRKVGWTYFRVAKTCRKNDSLSSEMWSSHTNCCILPHDYCVLISPLKRGHIALKATPRMFVVFMESFQYKITSLTSKGIHVIEISRSRINIEYINTPSLIVFSEKIPMKGDSAALNQSCQHISYTTCQHSNTV